MTASEPKLECDLIMRGGITSGIIYPRAIAKLAETYRFRCIGGTSAGAIAAAATAAAALGAKGGGKPFDDIKALPGELASDKNGKTLLERLFQPQPETGPLFQVLMAGLGRESVARKLVRLAAAAFGAYRGHALAAVAAVLLPLIVLIVAFGIEGAALSVVLALGAILAILAAALAVAYGMVRDIRHRLPDNGYGLCSGSSDMRPDAAGVLPLTDWLHEYFQKLAGRPLSQPVTFGELWGTKDASAERDIELVLMTTNVTRGISHRIPFLEGGWGQLFFKKEEFERLFPQAVVEWLTSHPAEIRNADEIEIAGFHALPSPADLPILLGTRMSLSFPFLLSAVPLYAVNFERAKRAGKFQLERCWFSDGGLTSNFPIHFFDAPLPSRPTFGINLIPDNVDLSETLQTDAGLTRVSGVEARTGARRAKEPGWDKIWMPAKNASGIGSAARFNNFDTVSGFFSALFDTARNWGDTELMALPGYRDRVVHVKLDENEGGLNLNMPPEIIEALGDRGERAGALLAARFARTPLGDEELTDPQTGDEVELTWDNHRWIRYRTMMAAFETLARRFRAAWQDAERQKPWRSYEALLRREGAKPRSYPLQLPEQRDFADAVTAAFVAFIADWTGDDRTFDRGENSDDGRSPRPKPVLRMMPAGSNDPRSERVHAPGGSPPVA